MENTNKKNRQSHTHGSIQIHIPYTYRIYGKERKNGIYQQRVSSETEPACIYARW
ncbi:hypothetical protein QW060_22260 [Myroides ceti]|uniref:Uncharacterized protein n=1 Tax=Paenimyroides ceti TaxID=395087 RepID=A0ABT8CYT1_9FLAO|nr:hypothetical protein [Paenimyroides ceti]MDN3709684.1 hypothetical protein [Paenimyroides ceti]